MQLKPFVAGFLILLVFGFSAGNRLSKNFNSAESDAVANNNNIDEAKTELSLATNEIKDFSGKGSKILRSAYVDGDDDDDDDDDDGDDDNDGGDGDDDDDDDDLNNSKNNQTKGWKNSTKEGNLAENKTERALKKICCFIFDPSINDSCKIRKNRPSAQKMGFSKEMMSPYQGSTVAEVVIETLPNIPTDLVDVLIRMQPQLVNFVIKSHLDLASLIAAAQPETLEHIFNSVPKFSKHLSQMQLKIIYLFLSRVPTPCQFIHSLQHDIAEMVVFKLPQLRHCLPVTANSTDPTTKAIEVTSRAVNVSSSQLANVELLFTKEELEKMMAKVPEIKKVLAKVNPEKLTALRVIHPNFMDLFDHLNDEFITFLKTFNPKNIATKTISEVFMAMAGENIAVQTFAKLFI